MTIRLGAPGNVSKHTAWLLGSLVYDDTLLNNSKVFYCYHVMLLVTRRHFSVVLKFSDCQDVHFHGWKGL